MTQPIKHDNTTWIKVPEGAKPYLVQDRLHFGEEGYAHKDNLPPGNWQLISLHSTMTEEKARECVEALDQIVVEYYRNYETKGAVYPTALESYHSLTRSLNMGSGEWTVLKQVK